jgi:hypothetical protein
LPSFWEILLALGLFGGLLPTLLLAVALILSDHSLFVPAVLAVVPAITAIAPSFFSIILPPLHADRAGQHQGGWSTVRVVSGKASTCGAITPSPSKAEAAMAMGGGLYCDGLGGSWRVSSRG